MTATQIKDLLNNMSKKTGVSVQILQRHFMIERLLERISLSEYKDNFILKGGILVAAIVGVHSRSTMDLDASIKNTSLTEDSIQRIFESLAAMDIGDDIQMVIKDVQEIREEFEYSCFRISMDAVVGNTVIPIKVDISTGDVITPSEIRYKINLLLENRGIEMWAYNLETILAEKMETVISRGVFNTRMRDFYDIYMLAKTRAEEISTTTLAKAFEETAKGRNVLVDYGSLMKDLSPILENESLQKHWIAYQNKFPYAMGLTWVEITGQVEMLFQDMQAEMRR